MNIRITPKEEIQYKDGKVVQVCKKLYVCNEREYFCEKICKFSLRFNVNESSDLDVLKFYLYLDELRFTRKLLIKFNVTIKDRNYNVVSSELSHFIYEENQDEYININLLSLIEESGLSNIYEIIICVSAETEGSALFNSNNTRKPPYILLEKKTCPIGPTGHFRWKNLAFEVMRIVLNRPVRDI